jgi:hypothetical protein
LTTYGPPNYDWRPKNRHSFSAAPDVIARDGALTLRMGPQKTTFLLRHHDRDAFELLRHGESGENLGAALFGIGPDRQANTVTIEALDLHNQGIFKRRPNRK